jgi:hypothetical protein
MSSHCHVYGEKSTSVKFSILFVILDFLPLKMENLLLGGRREAGPDEQLTCSANKSKPKSRTYDEIYIAFTFTSTLLLEKKSLNVLS